MKVDLPTPRRPMSFVVGGKRGNDFFSGCHGFRRLSSYLSLCYLLPFVSRSLQPNTTTHFFLLFPIFFQRNSISPTEREKYRNARSPMSSGDPHAPDMKKIKREDNDGHLRIIRSLLVSILRNRFSFSVRCTKIHVADGERSDQDLVVDDGGDVSAI